jgi:hypothetical protein
MRAYEISVKNAESWRENTAQTVFASTAGKAKYQYLRRLKDAFQDATFADLTCRALGDMPVPPTRREIAQREAAAFNSLHPVGTVLRYWSGLREGEPTGTAPINHIATVVCDSAVIWMRGVSSCHSLSHVEPSCKMEEGDL